MTSRVSRLSNHLWSDDVRDRCAFTDEKIYVVQDDTTKVIQRCISDDHRPWGPRPRSHLWFRNDRLRRLSSGVGVGSPSTPPAWLWLWRAPVSWGRAIPIYLTRGQPGGSGRKKQSSPGRWPSDNPTGGDIRQGFVYERVPHITLKSIANNAEIDVIWERWQETLEPLRTVELNGSAWPCTWEEWEIPREAGDPWPDDRCTAAWRSLQSAQTDGRTESGCATPGAERRSRAAPTPWRKSPISRATRGTPVATDLHRRWWEARIARQQEIDASSRRQGGIRVPLRQAL